MDYELFTKSVFSYEKCCVLGAELGAFKDVATTEKTAVKNKVNARSVAGLLVAMAVVFCLM